MITRRMVFPGNFVEAFVYFDFLWLISAEGDTWAFDIKQFLEAKFSDPAIAHQCMVAFARNDQILRRFEPNYVPNEIDVTAGELEQYSRIFDTRLSFGSILDMRCYYGRAFVATDSEVIQLRALSRSDLTHVPNGRRANGQLGGTVVHDARCVQFRCQFGMVSASCAYDGGFYAAGASSADPSWRATFKRFTDHSLATEFIADRLTNVPEADSIQFYKTDYHKAENKTPEPLYDLVEDELEHFEITKVEDQDRQSEERATRAVLGTGATYAGKVARVFLSRNYLFAVGYDHMVRSIKLTEGSALVAQPHASRPFPAANGPILAMTSSAIGMVAELDEEVAVLADGKWQSIFDEPVYSVRGYPASKWYKNLVTAVGSDKTELIFVSR